MREDARRDVAVQASRALPAWAAPVGVAAISVLASGLHAALGPGFVLDDWFTLRNAHFGGAWSSAGAAQQTARPGAAVTYAAVFGLIGQHPLAVLAVQAAVAAATASLLVVLLRSFFPEAISVTAAALWVVLPNHLSLEVWASAANIALCVLLAVAAGVVLVRDGPVRWLALPLLVASALCYEAILPLAAASVVVLPWAARGRVDRPLVVGGALGLGAVALWIVTHWHPDKHVTSTTADLGQAVGAHLGWGIAPDGPVASLLTLVGVIGAGLALVRLALPSSRPSTGPAERAVLTGVVVVVLGTAPFARYLYAPLGAGDRFNFASAVGGALVWSGLIALAWAWRRPVAVALLATLLGAGMVTRVERSVLWHRAGHDAVAIQREARRRVPNPAGPIALGPAPVQQQNVAAYLDQSNVSAALQIVYGDRDQVAVLTFSEAEFERFPASQRVDIRPVSLLRSDTDVRPG